MEQARAIERAISELVPENRQAHQAGLASLEARLTALDEALRLAFETFGDQEVIFSHPVYQYLAARYGLNGVSVHWEPGEDPGIKAWIDFREILRRHPAQLMIWEDDPVDATATQLLQLGINVLTFHAASNLPATGDYFDVMTANIERLQLQCCGTTIGDSE